MSVRFHELKGSAHKTAPTSNANPNFQVTHTSDQPAIKFEAPTMPSLGMIIQQNDSQNPGKCFPYSYRFIIKERLKSRQMDKMLAWDEGDAEPPCPLLVRHPPSSLMCPPICKLSQPCHLEVSTEVSLHEAQLIESLALGINSSFSPSLLLQGWAESSKFPTKVWSFWAQPPCWDYPGAPPAKIQLLSTPKKFLSLRGFQGF